MPATLAEEVAVEPTQDVLPQVDVMDTEFPSEAAQMAALFATINAPVAEIGPVSVSAVPGDEDVTMGGTQDPDVEQSQGIRTIQIPYEPPAQASAEAPVEAPTEAPIEVPTEAPVEVPTEAPTISIPVAPPKPEDILFFVKSFNHQAQKLNRHGAHLASKQEKIGEVLQRLQLVNPDTPYDLSTEDARDIMKPNIKARRSFESERLSHGAVIIIQSRLSPTE